MEGVSRVAASKELEIVIGQILRTQPRVARLGFFEDARCALAAIRDRDYDNAMSAQFSRDELRAIVARFSQALPALNRKKLRGTSREHLRRTARRLGADLQIGPVLTDEVQGLRGFYAGRSELLKRPLIWINSAQHRVPLAASFWHEVGHHLSAGFLDRGAARAIWSFDADYSGHLDDPLEILADVLPCLAAYPRREAVLLVAQVASAGGDSEADAILSVFRAHLRKKIGFDFEKRRPAAENLGYLAGMLHFAKVRVALLRSYDI